MPGKIRLKRAIAMNIVLADYSRSMLYSSVFFGYLSYCTTVIVRIVIASFMLRHPPSYLLNHLLMQT